MKKPRIIQTGKDTIVVTGNPGNIIFYKLKPIPERFYFTFNEVCTIIDKLPFSYEISPLNIDEWPDCEDPYNNLVEVYPLYSRILAIYPQNFRKIVRAYIDPRFEGNLKPSIIHDDAGEGGFRCSYFPKLDSFGLKAKTVLVPINSSAFVDCVEIDIHKFSENDSRRIYSFLKTLKDDSKEVKLYRTLEGILRKKY
jgi:hypothetical protein